ncbi:MAG: SpoVG family protein [Planctomycetota bacterium]|nr:SpoVG family protein [Planctomycetota bacterium]
MKVTNVTVKLSPHSSDRLKGFGTMTLDNEFVVRDLKIIEGTSGLFVAMPSRKLTDHCPKCRGKNHLRAKFCNDCGARLPERRVSDEEAQGKLHADVAHPINTECRNRLQQIILEAYEEERKRAGEPDAPAAEPDAPTAEPPVSDESSATPLDDEVDWGDALKEDDKKEEGSFGEGKPPPPSSFGEGIV